jgi:hypothetical protein
LSFRSEARYGPSSALPRAMNPGLSQGRGPSFVRAGAYVFPPFSGGRRWTATGVLIGRHGLDEGFLRLVPLQASPQKPSRWRKKRPIDDTRECRGTYEGAANLLWQFLFLLRRAGECGRCRRWPAHTPMAGFAGASPACALCHPDPAQREKDLCHLSRGLPPERSGPLQPSPASQSHPSCHPESPFGGDEGPLSFRR